MRKLPKWNISKESTQRFAGLLDRAGDLRIDPDAITEAGLPAWRTLTALIQATDSPEGPTRDRFLDRAQDALRALDAKQHGKLLLQFQARLLALQGRRGDEDVAHVTAGELVVPQSLQNPAVMNALQSATIRAGVPLDRLRVGSDVNAINPETGVSEFADPLTSPTEEITITASREGFMPKPGDEEMLARLMFSEGANQYAKHPNVFEAIGWSAFNRVREPGFKGGTADLQAVIQAPGQFDAVGQKHADGRPSLWDLSENPSTITGANKVAYAAARDTAQRLLNGDLADETNGAQYFHSAAQHPKFFRENLAANKIRQLNSMGAFKFFRGTER